MNRFLKAICILSCMLLPVLAEEEAQSEIVTFKVIICTN